MSSNLFVVNGIIICQQCLDGAGGMCHEPGCAMIRSMAPDLAIRQTILDAGGTIAPLGTPTPDAASGAASGGRVKGLEWHEVGRTFYATGAFGQEYFVEEREGDGYEWWGAGIKGGRADSIESAKLAAFAHYRARISLALEPDSAAEEAVKKIVDGIWRDVDGRSGMDLGQYDQEIQDDIRDSWTKIVSAVLASKLVKEAEKP